MKLSRSHIALGAGLAGGLLGLALVSGLGPAPALSGPSSDGSDDGTTGTTDATIPTSISSGPATAGATGATRVVDAGGAGTVTVAEVGTGLRLLKAEPASGWTVEVEESAGREVEVDFRRGTERVQVNLEIEDGAVRERVRFRDAATGAELLVEDGVVVGPDDDGTAARGDRDDDGTDDRGGDDDSAGPGRGHDADDDRGDDHGGHGGDDDHDDDHGGRGDG